MSSVVPKRPLPPEAWEPLLRVARIARRPLERFLHIEAASGALLMITAALALAWANSPWAASYTTFFATPMGVRVGDFAFERDLAWVVNDGLMVIFFFVVGLEIRREIHHGELSEWRRASLPFASAIGGMVVPALVYFAIAGQGASASGWGVPMATDIAFAVGVLALLGKRVPPALRVLLLALAVIDDLGAILVIAIFYSTGLSWVGFAVALAGFGTVVLMQRLGVRSKVAYILPSIVSWAGIYAGGVHPTIAGVIVGLMTPVRAWLGTEGFVDGLRREVEWLSQPGHEALTDQELAQRLHEVDVMRREARSPAESLIETLHPWVAFGIMPLFALANAGVSLDSVEFTGSGSRVALGAAAGLLLGKPVGVVIACVAVQKLGLATLPAGIGTRHLFVLGIVAGIGFTMSLFIAQLAFVDPALLDAAKLGVLAASIVAGLLALGLGRALLPLGLAADAATTADEAESSTER